MKVTSYALKPKYPKWGNAVGRIADCFVELQQQTPQRFVIFGVYLKLTDSRLGESSEMIRARVEKARGIQRQRFAAASGVNTNADMRPADVRVHCKLDDAGMSLVRAAMTQLQLSARAFHRILKLALTIADLAGAESIQAAHVAEAIQYRPRRKN